LFVKLTVHFAGRSANFLPIVFRASLRVNDTRGRRDGRRESQRWQRKQGGEVSFFAVTMIC
jgi:hypothetical protein